MALDQQELASTVLQALFHPTKKGREKAKRKRILLPDGRAATDYMRELHDQGLGVSEIQEKVNEALARFPMEEPPQVSYQQVYQTCRNYKNRQDTERDERQEQAAEIAQAVVGVTTEGGVCPHCGGKLALTAINPEEEDEQ